MLERLVRAAERAGELAGLYTMFDDGRPLGEAIERARGAELVTASRLGRRAAPARRWMLPLYPALVRELSGRLARAHASNAIDLLISSSSAAIKGLRAPANVPHLCYCHAPARYVWTRAEDYAGGLRGLGLGLAGPRYRAWDRATAARVDRFLANSTYTREQIMRCYGREAAVLHPPVRTSFFTPGSAKREDFWLVVSALEPYKRVDLAAAAARASGRRLLVAGTGSERRRLEREAGSLVRFLGRVDDDELRRLYRSAAVLLFPQVEDFGIVAAEALACGLPVVARRAGGALDIVEDGVTGALFDEPTVESLLDAVARAPVNGTACRAAAERFGEDAFDRGIDGHIRAALEAGPCRDGSATQD